MRYVIIGSLVAVGPFTSKGEAREYLERSVVEKDRHKFGIMALLPPKPPENGQLPI